MSTNTKSNKKFHSNETLEKEKDQLLKLYKQAIENDLPFEKTKDIYLQLKEIKIRLQNNDK